MHACCSTSLHTSAGPPFLGTTAAAGTSRCCCSAHLGCSTEASRPRSCSTRLPAYACAAALRRSFRLLPTAGGLFFENPRGKDFIFKYAQDFANSRYTLNAATVPAWRHVAITLDPSGPHMKRAYLHARHARGGPGGCESRRATCARKRRTSNENAYGVVDSV